MTGDKNIIESWYGFVGELWNGGHPVVAIVTAAIPVIFLGSILSLIITLPRAIAPFELSLVGLNLEDDAIRQDAEELYADLQHAGIEVLFDDRDEPPGVKFKDSDLIGMPLRVVISKRSLANGGLEVKVRREKEARTVPVADGVGEVQRLLADL